MEDGLTELTLLPGNGLKPPRLPPEPRQLLLEVSQVQLLLPIKKDSAAKLMPQLIKVVLPLQLVVKDTLPVPPQTQTSVISETHPPETGTSCPKLLFAQLTHPSVLPQLLPEPLPPEPPREPLNLKPLRTPLNYK
jgi:hypothetical protein